MIAVPRGSRLAGCEWALQPGGEPGLTGLVGPAASSTASAVASSRHRPNSILLPRGERSTLGAWPSSCARVVQRATVSARSPQDSLAARDAKSELPWLVEADSETFDAETSASVPVVVDFWAAWCGARSGTRLQSWCTPADQARAHPGRRSIRGHVRLAAKGSHYTNKRSTYYPGAQMGYAA